VGRLDKESRGLVLLTNDGELTFRLTHPKYHVPKTYLVTVVGTVSDMKIAKIRHGVDLEDGRTARAEVRILSQSRETTLEIVLFEGKKREIRRMCAALHLHVVDLQRVAFGSLLLDSLREGMWRKLTEKEVGALYVSVGLTKL
jgi:pseudouridine synthase